MAKDQKTEPQRTPGLIDIGTVAKLLGVSERYVRRLVAERRIDFVKVGHYVRFEPHVVREWVEDRRCRARPDPLLLS
ncbi:MAG: helix-turn-helix domain-containing protein [Acidimicrobiales bacterium]